MHLPRGTQILDPKNLNVPKGAGIEWTNNDNAPHTVTSSKDVGKSFDSSLIKTKQIFTLDTSKLTGKEYRLLLHSASVYERTKFTIKSNLSNSDNARVKTITAKQ